MGVDRPGVNRDKSLISNIKYWIEHSNKQILDRVNNLSMKNNIK